MQLRLVAFFFPSVGKNIIEKKKDNYLVVEELKTEYKGKIMQLNIVWVWTWALGLTRVIKDLLAI